MVGLTGKGLAVEVAGLRLRSPTLNASGVLGMSAPLLKRVYDSGAGAVVTKSLGPAPRNGHINPTLIEVEGGVLNAMGLPNPGVDGYLDELRELKHEGVPVVASFFASTVEEFQSGAKALCNAGVDALELNLSCPNVGGEPGMCAADAISVERVTAAVKEVATTPVFVKLSPNVTDIAGIAVAAERGGADAITAVNTLKAMAIDADFRCPILTNVTGGLSGPALKSVASTMRLGDSRGGEDTDNRLRGRDKLARRRRVHARWGISRRDRYRRHVRGLRGLRQGQRGHREVS